MQSVQRSLLLAFLLLAASCDSCGTEPTRQPPRAASAPSPRSSVAAPAAELKPAPPGEQVTIESSSQQQLAGELWPGDSGAAPLLVLVHRYRGQRDEWAPLLARLTPRGQFRVLTFDLRGHGDSKRRPDGKTIYWGAFDRKDIATLQDDVAAAVARGRRGVQPRGLVLVGSSLGAALASEEASRQPDVIAVGLISPGAELEGVSVYHAFAKVRELPALLLNGRSDNVSSGVVGSLLKMARVPTQHDYDSPQHSAQFLGKDQPKMWDDLAAWLTGVRDLQPTPPLPDADAGAAAAQDAASD